MVYFHHQTNKRNLEKQLTNGTISRKWKEDIITPIPKTKIVTNASELRPITVTEVPAKGLEKVVQRRIKQAVNKCVKEDQHAYKENDSAEIALIKIINNITEQINKEPSTIRILLVDIRKAFDSVEHPLLLHAMEESCCQSIYCYLPWIYSFFNRKKTASKNSGCPLK